MARDTFGSPGLRLVQLLLLLGSNGRQYSLTRLAGIFRCSRQTVLRMLESLERVPGITVESWMEGNNRYFRVTPKTMPAGVAVDAHALRYLCLCKDIVQHLLPAKVKEEINRTIGAAAFLTTEGADMPPALAESRGKGMIDYTPFHSHLETLQEGMIARRLCRVVYRNKLGGEVREHLIGPLKLVAFREAFYVRGRRFAPDGTPLGDKKPITLAVHRIVRAALTDTPFSPGKDTSRKGLFGFDFDPPFRVRVAFSAAVATYVSERRWSADQHFRRRRDGSLVLTFTASSRPEVKSWVLGFGSEAELLEPKALRREVAEMLAETLALYGNGRRNS